MMVASPSLELRMTTTSSAIETGRAQMQRDGFTVVRDYFSAAEARELIANVQRYIDVIGPTLPPTDIYMEVKGDPRTMFRLEHMDRHDAWFADLKNSARLRDLASAMLGEPAVVQHIETFGKAPRVGNVTPPHQDGNYFKIIPNHALTLWIPVDVIDAGNGTIRYVPGSHLKGMRNHAVSDVFGFSLGITDFGDADKKNEVAIVTKPGDVVIHHSMTIHRAEKNESDRLRRAIGLVFYAASARQDDAAVKAHDEKIKAAWKKSERL